MITIEQFMINNPQYLTGGYSDIAKKYGVSYETVRHVARKLRRSNIEPKASNAIQINPEEFAEFKAWKVSKSPKAKYFKRKKELPKPYLNGDPNNVLVIPDTHLPFELDDALEFLREQQEKWNCGTVVHIGDFLDNCSTSFFDKDPDGFTPGDEFMAVLEKAKDWYSVFPNVKVCIGNHDARPFRQAFKAGLPKKWLKTYEEMLNCPEGWEWDFNHEINGVIYTHGTGSSGDLASMNLARENRQSTVIGHLHSLSNIRYLANSKDTIFGMTVGCLLKNDEYAFSYGKEMPRKPVLNCGVVLNGTLPILIPYSK